MQNQERVDAATSIADAIAESNNTRYVPASRAAITSRGRSSTGRRPPSRSAIGSSRAVRRTTTRVASRTTSTSQPCSNPPSGRPNSPSRSQGATSGGASTSSSPPAPSKTTPTSRTRSSLGTSHGPTAPDTRCALSARSRPGPHAPEVLQGMLDNIARSSWDGHAPRCCRECSTTSLASGNKDWTSSRTRAGTIAGPGSTARTDLTDRQVGCGRPGPWGPARTPGGWNSAFLRSALHRRRLGGARVVQPLHRGQPGHRGGRRLGPGGGGGRRRPRRRGCPLRPHPRPVGGHPRRRARRPDGRAAGAGLRDGPTTSPTSSPPRSAAPSSSPTSARSGRHAWCSTTSPT